MAAYDPRRMERLLRDMEEPKSDYEMHGGLSFGSLFKGFKPPKITPPKVPPPKITPPKVPKPSAPKPTGSKPTTTDGKFGKAFDPITSKPSAFQSIGSRGMQYANYAGLALGIGLPAYQISSMISDAKKAKEDEAAAAAAQAAADAQGVIAQAEYDKTAAEDKKRIAAEIADAEASKKYWEDQSKLSEESYAQAYKQQQDAAAAAAAQQKEYYEAMLAQSLKDQAIAAAAALAAQQASALSLDNYWKNLHTQPTTTVPITSGPTPSYPPVTSTPKPPSSGRRGRGMVGGLLSVMPRNLGESMPEEEMMKISKRTNLPRSTLKHFIPQQDNRFAIRYSDVIGRPPRAVEKERPRPQDNRSYMFHNHVIGGPPRAVERPPPQAQFSTNLPTYYQPAMMGSGKKPSKATMVSDMVHHFGVSKAEAKKIIKMHNL